ncbi:2-polyprenylphenol 6-hydroxylase [Abyssibius alkaniclasticus]|uniref:2-polyprenylphenol 6-hydroxylase n=1 Tax=Abyssibius alkaniclasticus TaxID=2881234 RepID=UPI0023639D77|nr:2-polyprenylphenol 6-hydroxylase [Abyssibius alkaniclasticus]UPH72335.1 2-polyprenylphenol 6-hydroxylase [Abyssibius alkaniclasticus]
MRGPHNIWRLIRTGATFERSGAMRVALDALDAPRSLRIAARILGWPFAWLGLKGDPSQPPILRALTALGPAYIKFGQLLSTRPDLVGEDLATELRVLQDRLPAFERAIAKVEVERELGIRLDDVFSEFSEPIAAASLAQVHKAKLRATGETVAVKVLRPGIERAFLRDVDAFHLAAWMVSLIAPQARRLRPREVIKHFEGVVLAELDLRTEASAGDEFAENTANDAGFTVPKLHWNLSARRVMTSSWADGVPLGDVKALAATGYDAHEFATRIIQLFLRQALRDGLFHGDMHQGNLKRADNGDLIAYDFGIMGRIDPYTRRVYAEILMGFLHRDYRRTAEVHFEAGYVPADRDIDEFAQALRAVAAPIFGHNSTQISIGRLLAHLFEVTERFGMEARTELILLQRTMVVVEGVARSLDPTLNIWDAARPVVEAYIRDNLGPRAMLRDLGSTMRVLARFGPHLPKLAETLLQKAAQPAPVPRRKPLSAWLGLGVGLVFGALAMWLFT